MAHSPACITERVPLAPLTTFGIGGPARFLARPSTRDEAAAVFEFADYVCLPILVLGGGSNLLVADAGVDAIVIRLEDAGEFSRIDMDAEKTIWRVGAATPLQALIAATVREGFAGLTFFAGIPGRVGGAVAMNAGPVQGGIGCFVAAAEVLGQDGKLSILRAPDLAFSYRHSTVKGRLAIRFVMEFSERAAPEALREEVRSHRERKKNSQPLGLPSAGCVFKNPVGNSAGRLLDQAGCKGMTEGGASVSERHANFIVNSGGASCRDVATLAMRMRDRVHADCGIVLEPEIALWGEDAAFSRLREDGAV